MADNPQANQQSPNSSGMIFDAQPVAKDTHADSGMTFDSSPVQQDTPVGEGVRPANNIYAAAPDEQTPEGSAAALARRQAAHPILTAVGKGSGEALGDIWDAVKGLPNGILHSLPPVQFHDTIKQAFPVFQAYEQSRSSGKGVWDSLRQANEVAKQHDAAQQALQARIDEFKQNPGPASVRAVADAAALAATIYDGGPLNPANTELPEGLSEANAAARANAAESSAATPKPGIVKQILKGKDVAQPEAQAAMRSAANASEGTSLREVLSKPIADAQAEKEALYKAYDEAAGVDRKALQQRLNNTHDQLDKLTNTPADIRRAARLNQSKAALEQQIAEADAKAKAAGINIGDADAANVKLRALQEVESKIFHNQDVIQGNTAQGAEESVNIDSAIKAVQKIQDNEKFGGPRFDQAFGTGSANKLLTNLRQYQASGVHALKVQSFAKVVGATLGIGTLGGVGGRLGFKALQHLTSSSAE